jgi:hypothetical protein
MSKAKAKGTAAETAFVNWLREQSDDYVTVERRVTNGAYDRGDIAGIPHTVIEIKSGARLNIQEWLRELDAEIANAKALVGYLVIKPKGIGSANVQNWWIIQRVGDVFGK